MHIPPKKTPKRPKESHKMLGGSHRQADRKTVFVYRSPFPCGNGEFFVQRRNSQCTIISEASGAARVQCNLNAIFIFRQKSLTPSLNGRRYTVLYENSAGV
jgi:hypothetical protein